MIIYYVVSDDVADYGLSETIYGYFSTYEKAKEFLKEFAGLDGFGVCTEDLVVEERKLELDKVEDWVMELINNARKRKEKYYNKES